MSKPIIQELLDAHLAIKRALAALEGSSDESRPVDWVKSNIDWQAIARRTVETEARRVKEMFREPTAPTWHTKGYQDAVERAREAHFATLRRNGIDTPVADCNDPYGIKDLDKLSSKELLRLLKLEDRPGPRRDAIWSALQNAPDRQSYLDELAGLPPKAEKRPLTDEEIDGVTRWAAKRELERGKPPADDPRPRAETIVVADKYITPMRDDPGAGVFFKRRWWWPF